MWRAYGAKANAWTNLAFELIWLELSRCFLIKKETGFGQDMKNARTYPTFELTQLELVRLGHSFYRNSRIQQYVLWYFYRISRGTWYFFASVLFLNQRVYLKRSSSLVLLDWLTAGRMALKELWQFTRWENVLDRQWAECPGCGEAPFFFCVQIFSIGAV